MKKQTQNDILKGFLGINRKLHILLGLFLLLFIWLFFVSGLIIHHSEWKFARFYENRKESSTVFIVSKGLFRDDNLLIRYIEAQLKIVGEVSNFKKDTLSIDFRISSPGQFQEIHIDSKTGYGTMKATKYNFWGKLRTLHLFNGMDRNNPSVSPNWIITKLWRIMMDVTAVVLIILCLGSWVMWFNVRREYKLGYIFLAVGLIVTGYYMFVIDLL
jgi:hypothetical protein